MDLNILQNEVNTLKSSPIYAMSLGSKELFHSNFWSWIMENEFYRDDFVKFFFPNLGFNNPILVTREEGNRDLTIWTNNKTSAYVIENKFKSIPTEEQLIRYQDKLSEKFAGGVLTGILQPNINLHNWAFKSYKQIAEKLIEIAQKDIKYKDIVLEYAENIKIIYNLLTYSFDFYNNKLPYRGTAIHNFLEQINLWDICQKSIADDFLRCFLEEYSVKLQKLCNNQININKHINYSHSEASINLTLKIATQSETELTIGVQIQGEQFKIFVHETAPNRIEDLYDEFLNIGWFDSSYSKENKQVFGFKTKMKPVNNKNYNKYGGDSSFVYQYFNINEDNNSYKALFSLAYNFLEKAKKILDENFININNQA